MSVYQTKHIRVVGEWSMEPDTKKIIRGLIYTIAMGVITLVVIIEGATQLNVMMGIFYIIGALLVFGIDIDRIELWPPVIEFDSDEHSGISAQDRPTDKGESE